jgi:hypothetical protein
MGEKADKVAADDQAAADKAAADKAAAEKAAADKAAAAQCADIGHAWTLPEQNPFNSKTLDCAFQCRRCSVPAKFTIVVGS